MHSPDNSYHGSVALEVHDRGGKQIETIPIGIGFGTADWQVVSTSSHPPARRVPGQIPVQLNKTYGSFWLDELSAAPLSTQPIVQRVERVLLATDAVGNLFLPGDKVRFHVTVEAVEPLEKNQQLVRYSVRDYWGAPQLPPGEAVLDKAPRKEDRFVYSTKIELPEDRLEVGKYYELHVEIPQESGDPVREYSGLAILPPAAAKKCSPEQVPFTIRNWDSRIPVYFHLADRLGLRLLGVWGGWSAKAPYKPQCPGIDLCNELGAKWITGTPASSVERQGFTEYDEQALRQGMANFLKEYAGRGLAMIAMGNEPHGTGQKVLDNVRAYKAIYETVKAFDPKHPCHRNLGRAERGVLPGRIPELPRLVRFPYLRALHQRAPDDPRVPGPDEEIQRRQADPFDRVGTEQPGPDAAGRGRGDDQEVSPSSLPKAARPSAGSRSSIRTRTAKPAASSATRIVSSTASTTCTIHGWMPSPTTTWSTGSATRSSSRKHAIPTGRRLSCSGIRRGAASKCCGWTTAREDVLVPLPANQNVELVRLDGSRATLHSTHGGISLTLSAEPVLLFYQDATAGARQDAGKSHAVADRSARRGRRAATSVFSLQGQDLATESLRVIGPPLWTITLKPAGENQIECTIRAPAATPAREARIYVQRVSDGKTIADLTVPIPVAGND